MINNPSSENLIKNIEQTMLKSKTVLDHFEKMLVSSGFDHQKEIYTKMGNMILNQALWIKEREKEEVRVLQQEIAEKAQRILIILTPYYDLMRKLSVLTEINKNDHS